MKLCSAVVRPGKYGWGPSGKNIVFGIYQRDGKMLTFPISLRAKNTKGFWSFAKHWLYQYWGIPKPCFYFYLKKIGW